MDGDATATCSSADREGQGRRGRGAAVVAAGRRDIQREHLHGHAPPRTPRGKPPTNQPMTFSASAAMDRCGLGQELKLAGPDGPCARACRSPSTSTSRTARACSAPCSPTRAGASGSATYVLTTSYHAHAPADFFSSPGETYRFWVIVQGEWQVHMLPLQFLLLTVRPVVVMQLRHRAGGLDLRVVRIA